MEIIRNDVKKLRDILKENIKNYRLKRKLTQSELAGRVGISINFLSDIENGKRWISPASIVKFSRVLNIEPYELFKPAEAINPTVLAILSKYNDEVIQAVSTCIKQIHDSYRSNNDTDTCDKSMAIMD